MKELNTIRGTFFDTINTITCDVSEANLCSSLALCDTYEQVLSRFAPGSDVWRINHAEGMWVEVCDDTITLLACAEQVRHASAGAFNVAVGSIAELWDFSGRTTALPSDEEVEQARQRMEQAVVSLEGNCVQVPAGTTIDLGGIAKGYICDCVADSLREDGATSGILNFGGNVVTIGNHPEGRPWQVGLQSPTAGRDKEIFASIASTDNAVVTSGVYERAFALNGQLYHHIIDPRTCYPAELNTTSATVIAEDGMLADALATALLIMEEEAGFALLEQFGAKGVALNTKHNLRYSQGLPIKFVDD